MPQDNVELRVTIADNISGDLATLISDEIWQTIGHHLRKGDDNTAASERLAEGFPIYYSEDDTPAGLVIKRHPCGRRELVRCDPAGDQVIRVL